MLHTLPSLQVEIGKCISAVVRLYDENDNLMDIPTPNMIDIRPEFESKIANIQVKEKGPDEKWEMGEVHFIITGKLFLRLLRKKCFIFVQ